METLKENFSYFIKGNLFVYFGKRKPPKNPFCFKNLFHISKATFRAQKIKKNRFKKFRTFWGNGTF